MYLLTYLLTAVPGEPRKVRAEVVNSTAVKLSWRPPSDRDANGIVRGYRVHYVPLGHLDEPLVNVPAARLDLPDGLRTELVVAGLRPDTVYQFELEAYTRKGRGERSRPRKVRTNGAGPDLLPFNSVEYSTGPICEVPYDNLTIMKKGGSVAERLTC